MYDEKSFLAGIAVGRNMKSWPRMEAPKQNIFAWVINVTNANTTYEFLLNIQSGKKCIVHWGDGQSEEIENNFGERFGFHSHTYGLIGMYRILVVGPMNSIYPGNGDGAERLVYKIDTIAFYPVDVSTATPSEVSVTFADCQNLVSVPDKLFINYARNDGKKYNLSRSFAGCDSLQKVPSALFSGMSLYSIDSLFSGCSGLHEIPADLFAGADFSSLATFTKVFEDCGFHEIPDTLFDNVDLSNVTDAYGMFYSSSVTDIPHGLLDAFPNVTRVREIFASCHGLTSLPSDLFSSIRNNITDFSRAFRSCTYLISMSSGLFSNCGEAENFEEVFDNCWRLESIPPDLFASCPNVTNFKHAFYGCTHVTGPVPRLWETHPNADGTGCFGLCTSASNYADIPASWK